ncbi:hypothetical protein MMC09_005488 [Bachmanniomyces sp. S44760]|nr:hypothetical protein [Bachmanniomyces sp. S44760]
MADLSSNPRPSTDKPAGERLATYFENFFKTITAICTLGASITFAKIVQSPVEPFHEYGVTTHGVQWYLALSWMFFVICLAFTSLFASALSLYRPFAVDYFGMEITERRKTVLWYASGVSALLYALLISAFIFVSLVVVAYAGPVGWITITFTLIFAIIGFGSIIYQSPLFGIPGDPHTHPRVAGLKFRAMGKEAHDPIMRHLRLHGLINGSPTAAEPASGGIDGRGGGETTGEAGLTSSVGETGSRYSTPYITPSRAASGRRRTTNTQTGTVNSINPDQYQPQPPPRYPRNSTVPQYDGTYTSYSPRPPSSSNHRYDSAQYHNTHPPPSKQDHSQAYTSPGYENTRYSKASTMVTGQETRSGLGAEDEGDFEGAKFEEDLHGQDGAVFQPRR